MTVANGGGCTTIWEAPFLLALKEEGGWGIEDSRREPHGWPQNLLTLFHVELSLWETSLADPLSSYQARRRGDQVWIGPSPTWVFSDRTW
jgi:hypothetical protein